MASPFQIGSHATVFGGVRDDVRVVTLAEPLFDPFLLEDLVTESGLPIAPDRLATLVTYGAIYVSHYKLSNQLTSQNRSRKAAPDWSNIPIQTVRYRQESDAPWLLPRGTKSVRFHLVLRRFERVPRILWPERFRLDTDEFLFVEKPAGIPCEPVASNWIESLAVQAGKAYGADLGLLHRIDLWVSGVVCLGKSKAAAQLFNTSNIVKVYRLLVAGTPGRPPPPSNGHVYHWMAPGACFRMVSPRLVRTCPTPSWKECQCTIRRVRSVPYAEVSVKELEPAYRSQILAELERLKAIGSGKDA